MRYATFSPGQVIFHEADSSQEAYRILRGRVEITIEGKNKPIILAQLGEGDIFGEMAMVDERPRSATARCTERTECEVMSPVDFQLAVLKHPIRLLPYLATFFERLRTVNDRLHLEMRLRAEKNPANLSDPINPPTEQSVDPEEQTTENNSEITLFQNHMEEPNPDSNHIVHAAVLCPLTPLCASKLPEDSATVEISKFPFKIGRRVAEDDGRHAIFSTNDFVISDQEPYQVSRSHCSVEREGDHFFVRDRGSTLGTIVNDTPIGVHYATLTSDLRLGENTITIGSNRSPYKFQIRLV